MYRAYVCKPCGGTGRSMDPTLTDNANVTSFHRMCPYCRDDMVPGLIHVLEPYRPPRYVGERRADLDIELEN